MLKEIAAGDSVSYGGLWKASKPTLVGWVPVGYGDGLPRSLGGKAKVLVGGVAAPIIGAVCMDYFCIDLSEHVQKGVPIKVGDSVVLIGSQGEAHLSVEELAKLADTIPYEIVTSVGGRVARTVIED